MLIRVHSSVYVACDDVGAYVCVGESSRRHWSSTENIHWRQVAWALITGQWRSRVGRWLVESSHSTAEQRTTTTTRPHWHKLSTQAVGTRTTMLRWTQISTLRCTRQQWKAVVVAWRRLAIESTLSVCLIAAALQLAADIQYRRQTVTTNCWSCFSVRCLYFLYEQQMQLICPCVLWWICINSIDRSCLVSKFLNIQ